MAEPEKLAKMPDVKKDDKQSTILSPIVEKFSFVDNDTIAVVGLIVLAVISLAMEGETIASAAIGAIGGYIGSKTNK
ncbi:hypothetical protein RFF05_06925 [Bengtsoniella intestinalis]|uniref:hypothetical protein n=1 Tax=Bengtsoniella intestinalis TaxID=3073143 RepID=UPI00391FAF3B